MSFLIPIATLISIVAIFVVIMIKRWRNAYDMGYRKGCYDKSQENKSTISDIESNIESNLGIIVKKIPIRTETIKISKTRKRPSS